MAQRCKENTDMTRSSHAIEFSILIPTKNRPDLLVRAVSSALNSIKNGGEIVVIDDQSAVPAKIVLSDPLFDAIRIVRTDGRGGVGAARNLGMQSARGKILFFLDDDDELMPDYVEQILADAVQSAGYGFSALSVVDDSGAEKIEGIRFPNGLISNHHLIRRRICGTGMGFWIRQDVRAEIGWFDTELSIWEDTEYLCRLISRDVPAWFSATPGVRIHMHATNERNIGNITVTISHGAREKSLRRTLRLHPFARNELALTYIKDVIKAGLYLRGWLFARRYVTGSRKYFLYGYLAAHSIPYLRKRRRRTT
jgi:glycosyltransferase involved in cell wall biosynthesis